MKAWLEAAGVLVLGVMVAACAAVFILVSAGHLAWNSLGDDEDGQHRH